MDNRFYLQALGVTGLFIGLMFLIWIATGGPASEAAIQNANQTRTAIAMTGSYLLQPRTRTPAPAEGSASPSAPALLPSATATSLLPQLITPLASPAASFIPIPSQTLPPVPVFTITSGPGHANTKAPPLFPRTATPTGILVFAPSATPAVSPAVPGSLQDPADFARWYFTRVWNERDYQNLWDNYLTASYKANVGSGLFEDYVWWWNSVQRVDVNAVEVLQNTGTDAWARVHLTIHMTDGRVVDNQVYDYDLLYDPSRNTWMFDASP